ncbi:MAG: hypothetical protein ACTSUZ_08290 [Candidatus Thorarchaeota archaeon]
MNWLSRMKIAKRKATSKEIDIPLPNEVKDVTTEASKLIREFAPRISLVGRELWMERNTRVWQGPQVRALEYNRVGSTSNLGEVSTPQVKRLVCLQYLFLYGRQYGAVSFLSMIAAPFLLLAWVRILDNMVFEELHLIGVGALVSILLLEKGFRSYYSEYIRRKWDQASTPLVRVEAVYIWLGCVAFVPAIDVWIASILYLGTFLVGLFVWLAELGGLVPWTHYMDYVPVFVWLSPKSNINADLKDPNTWQVFGAIWDEYHYETHFRDPDYMREFMKISKDTPLKRIQLKIDNRWHSLSSSEKWAESPRSGTAFFFVGVTVFMISCLAITLLYIDPVFYQTNYPTSGYCFLFFIFLLVVFGIYRNYYPLVTDRGKDGWDIITTRDLDKYHLTHGKLVFLWNLDEEKAQLEICTKMQNPFIFDSEYLSDFRDPVKLKST